MKKFLLFALVLVFSVSIMAQNKVQTNLLKKSKDIDLTQQNNLPEPVLNTSAKAINDVNRIYVGKAKDYRSVRKEDTRAISYNPELGVITITFIMDPATYGSTGTDIGMVYSTDMGETWSQAINVVNNGGSFTNDFPSGIVFNPAGNSELDNAFGVVQNISHVGGDWGYKMWSSIQLNGDNRAIEISHNPDNIEDGYWNQFGLKQIGNEVRCLNMLPTGDWGNYQTAELQPIYGEFNGTSFNWDDSQYLEMDLYQNSEDGTMAWIGGYQAHDGGIEMAWSDYGQVGYMWMIGVNNSTPSGYRPLLFKTVDGGDSWDFIEIDFLNDEMQAFLEPYIIENSEGVMIPSIFESTGVVDHRGNLQMFVAAASHFADVLTYPDSLVYGILDDPGNIFNITIGDEGIVDIIWVDSLNTENLISTTEGNYNGDGWQHRISCAKNHFENEVFLTWIDSRDLTSGYNTNPDIFGWSKNIHTNEVSESVCFTEGTLYETFYYYTYGAERAIYDEGTHSYTIPYMQTISPGEFASNGATSPVSISYVTGIEFPALGDFVGISEQNTEIGFRVSSNQPNPFSGTTTIEVSTVKPGEAKVNITNMLGQTVSTINAGTINGTQSIEINAENLNAGVYFYTVTIGNESVTQKMIVE